MSALFQVFIYWALKKCSFSSLIAIKQSTTKVTWSSSKKIKLQNDYWGYHSITRNLKSCSLTVIYIDVLATRQLFEELLLADEVSVAVKESSNEKHWNRHVTQLHPYLSPGSFALLELSKILLPYRQAQRHSDNQLSQFIPNYCFSKIILN